MNIDIVRRVKERYGRWDWHMRDVVSGAAAALLVKVAAAAAGFALSVAVARAIGAEGSGIYYLAFTIMSMGAMIGRLGLDNVIVRYVAGARAEGAWDGVRAAYARGLLIVPVASGALSLAGFVAAPLLAVTVFSKPELTATLRIMSLAILPTALATMHAQSLLGLKRVVAAMALLSLWTPLLTLAGVLLVTPDLGVRGAAYALFGASVLTAVIGAAQWRAAVRGRSGGSVAPPAVAEMLDRGIPLLWVALMNATYRWVPTLLLGLWVESAQIGIYGVAQRVAFLLAFILLAVNSIVAPMFAEFHQRGEIANLRRVARSSAKLMAIVTLPPVLVLVFAPGFVLSIFGEEFRSGALVLALLAIGQYINVATGSVGYVLVMTGHERTMRNIMVGTAATNLVLCLTLIPVYGITGAAIATAVGMSAQNIIAAFVASRILAAPDVPMARAAPRVEDDAG